MLIVVQQNSMGEFALKNVRVWFTKDDEAKYISHLDLNRCMSRVIHRSDIKIWYTQGFNPHPFITFALPLSLGIRGLRESMDIKLIDDVYELEIIEKLNNCLPSGIRIFDVTGPLMKPGKISYALFKIQVFSQSLSNSEVLKIITDILKSPEIIVEKETKSGTKEINLKQYLSSYSINCNNENNVSILITLPAGSDININPYLVLDAIKKYGNINIFSDISRLDLYNSEMEQFK